MQQGFMSQGGMVSIFQDFPMSPDMVSEVKVLTSNYAPEYGSSTAGQIMAVTKSGGSSFHGSAFEFYRDQDSLQAKQWGGDGDKAQFKQEQLRRQHRRSRRRCPGSGASKVKSYFYFDYEGYRAGRAAPTGRPCRFRRWRSATATSATGATPPAT